MSGHNKWSTIKHKKGKADAARSKIFTKLIKEITIAARSGGSGDPDMNPRLRTAIAAAKAANMPNDNIGRAIKKGTGELEGAEYFEISYEGYGPGGVALLIDVVTDNKNRTVAEVRHVLSKYGGKMGESGSVSWQFESKGQITVPADAHDEDTVMEHALEAGAEDVESDGEYHTVSTDVGSLEDVRSAFEAAGITIEEATIAKIATMSVPIDSEKTAHQLLRIMEYLEDLDDVQNVWSNFDMDDAFIESYGS